MRTARLSRFAWYLIAITGDPNKPGVAAAQAYFTAMTEVARQAMLDGHKFERRQGRRVLGEEVARWEQFAAAIALVLEAET